MSKCTDTNICHLLSMHLSSLYISLVHHSSSCLFYYLSVLPLFYLYIYLSVCMSSTYIPYWLCYFSGESWRLTQQLSSTLSTGESRLIKQFSREYSSAESVECLVGGWDCVIPQKNAEINTIHELYEADTQRPSSNSQAALTHLKSSKSE